MFDHRRTQLIERECRYDYNYVLVLAYNFRQQFDYMKFSALQRARAPYFFAITFLKGALIFFICGQNFLFLFSFSIVIYIFSDPFPIRLLRKLPTIEEKPKTPNSQLSARYFQLEIAVYRLVLT